MNAMLPADIRLAKIVLADQNSSIAAIQVAGEVLANAKAPTLAARCYQYNAMALFRAR